MSTIKPTAASWLKDTPITDTEQDTKPRVVKVGVIGYGYWGPKLVRNFHEVPSAKLAMVADLDENRLDQVRRAFPDAATTTDYRELLESDVDAVVVATPVSTHFPVARDCLRNGKHVLIEKPLARNRTEGQALVDLAKARNLILMVGHTFEYNPAVLMLRDIVASGEIGRVYYAYSQRTNLGLFQKDINVLWDLAPHDLSILLYVLGADPTSVSASGESYVRPGIHDVARVTLNFPEQVQAHVHVSWLDPCKVRRLTVVGSKKMVVYDDVEMQEKIKIYDKGVDKPAHTDNYGEFQLSYRYGDIKVPMVPLDEPLKIEATHFAESIINNTQPRSNGEVGLKVVKILESTDKSLLNGGMQEQILW